MIQIEKESIEGLSDIVAPYVSNEVLELVENLLQRAYIKGKYDGYIKGLDFTQGSLK